MISGKKISAIIPVYNECPHLDKVISNLVKIKCIDEFICINDGSTDNSLKVLEKYNNRINIVTYENNRGKGFAVAQGLKLAKGDIIVLLDADIRNYKELQIKSLIKPLTRGKYRFTIGKIKCISGEIFKIYSGIRAYFITDLKPLIKELEKSSKYGIEPILNIKLRNKQHRFIPLFNVDHKRKYNKYDFGTTAVEYWKEGKSLTQEYIRIIKDIQLW
jgi:glycosyltransferase involved in cell wall biosynthesis